MKKQVMKSINWIVVAVAAVALLSLVAIAYAQENTNKNHMSNNDMMDMMGGKGMDEMHKQCEKLHENGKFVHNILQGNGMMQ